MNKTVPVKWKLFWFRQNFSLKILQNLKCRPCEHLPELTPYENRKKNKLFINQIHWNERNNLHLINFILSKWRKYINFFHRTNQEQLKQSPSFSFSLSIAHLTVLFLFHFRFKFTFVFHSHLSSDRKKIFNQNSTKSIEDRKKKIGKIRV